MSIVTTYIGRSLGAYNSAKARGAHFWTDAEISLLKELRQDEAMDWPEIAKELGIDADKCRTKFMNMVYQERTRRGENQPHGPSNAALLNRERRARARDHQTITGQIFGDPPPGFSAFDRRRATP